ncbi:MAG TPA: hypothetical protein VLR88_11170 [Propionibacteriaceae bacterium]|nr:hypothetical protein [Propionibacteriaceae bacterium]
MLTPQEPPPALIDLALGQGGYLSHDQVTRMGLKKRQIERLCRTRWQRHARGLYYLGLQEPTFEAKAWGGVLLGGDDAVVGGQAAARLLGLRVDEPRELEILIPGPRHKRNTFPYRFRSDNLGRRSRGAPPRTSVEDTILDVLSDPETSQDSMSALIGEAVDSRLTTVNSIRQRLAERPVQPRRLLLLEVVGDAETGSRSALERRYLKDVERAHGLPAGRWQVRTMGAVVDVLYEEFGLISELDGAAFHRGGRRQRDRHRDNAHLIELGLVTLRFGWAEVAYSPCLVADEVAAVLQARGWQGTPTACRHCRKRNRIA